MIDHPCLLCAFDLLHGKTFYFIFDCIQLDSTVSLRLRYCFLCSYIYQVVLICSFQIAVIGLLYLHTFLVILKLNLSLIRMNQKGILIGGIIGGSAEILQVSQCKYICNCISWEHNLSKISYTPFLLNCSGTTIGCQFHLVSRISYIFNHGFSLKRLVVDPWSNRITPSPCASSLI